MNEVNEMNNEMKLFYEELYDLPRFDRMIETQVVV